jgi:hypothetical protein
VMLGFFMDANSFVPCPAKGMARMSPQQPRSKASKAGDARQGCALVRTATPPGVTLADLASIIVQGLAFGSFFEPGGAIAAASDKQSILSYPRAALLPSREPPDRIRPH